MLRVDLPVWQQAGGGAGFHFPLYQKMKCKCSSAIVYCVLYKLPPFIPQTNPYQYFILIEFHFGHKSHKKCFVKPVKGHVSNTV